MATARSEDLRKRAVLAVVEEGLARREAARRFKVGDASVVRWVAAYKAEGRVKPLPQGGDRRSKLKPHRDWLVALRLKESSLTLEAIAMRFLEEKGVKASVSMLSSFFAAEGIRFKKNRARQRAGASRRGRGARGMAPDAA